MTGTRRRLAENFVSLSIVQGLSILFPLLIFPYLLRVLGVAGFGVFTLVQTFIMYFDLLVSFGFGLTATQRITKYQNDPHELNRIISAVYIIKILLFSFSVIVFLATAIFIPYVKEKLLLIFVASLYLLGNLFMPDWYFQGVQKMKTITTVAFISRCISFLLIILLVKSSNDVVYAILAMGAGNLIAGITGFGSMIKGKKITWENPGKSYLKDQFKESSYVFSSIILAPLYSSVNLFILQFFTNPLVVGTYAVAEKIFTAVSMFTSIVNRTFYPHLAQLWETSITGYRKNVKNIIYGFVAAFFAIAVFQFFGAEFILMVVGGKKNMADVNEAALLLHILSVALIYSPFVSFFFQLMVLQNQKKETVPNIIITVVINLITASIAAYYFGAVGMAVNLALIMLLIAFLNFRGFYRGLLKKERLTL